MAITVSKVLAITQARYGSTRLPGKVLLPAGNSTLLQIHLERILKSKQIDKLILATTLEEKAIELVQIASSIGVESYQGSTNDVLDRFYQAAKPHSPEWVVRLTSDCPLIDHEIIDATIDFCIHQEGPRRPLPQHAGEGQGHDHVPGQGEPASRAWARPSDATRRGHQGCRADRAAASDRRTQHDHGLRADKECRSEPRCQK